MILLSLSLLLIFGLEIKSTLAEDTLRQVFQDHPNLPAGQAQDPMMDLPGILMPGSSDKAKQDHPVALSISDVIGKERIINIFAGFTSMRVKQNCTANDAMLMRYYRRH